MNSLFSYASFATFMMAIIIGIRSFRSVTYWLGMSKELNYQLSFILFLLTIILGLIAIIIKKDRQLLLFAIIVLSMFAIILYF